HLLRRVLPLKRGQIDHRQSQPQPSHLRAGLDRPRLESPSPRLSHHGINSVRLHAQTLDAPAFAWPSSHPPEGTIFFASPTNPIARIVRYVRSTSYHLCPCAADRCTW